MVFSTSLPRNAISLLYALLLACGLWLSASGAQAQLNVEALATSVRDPGHHGLLSSTVSVEAGNVSLYDVQGQAAYVFTNAHPDAPEDDMPPGFWFLDRFLAEGSASYKRTPSEKLASGGLLHLRYTRMQWLRAGFEAFGQLQYDDFRLLTRRIVTGGGGRFVLTRSTNFAAWLGTGYMVEDEERQIPEPDRPPQGPDPKHMVNHRWNNYLTLMAMQGNERVNLANTVYIQPRFDDPADIQILDELSMGFSINDWFRFTVGFSFRYDSRAPRSVEEHDVKLTQGFTITL